MTDEEMFPPITRICHRGENSCSDLAFHEFDSVLTAHSEGRRWYDGQDSLGASMRVSLEDVTDIIQLSTAQRLAVAEAAQARKLRFPD